MVNVDVKGSSELPCLLRKCFFTKKWEIMLSRDMTNWVNIEETLGLLFFAQRLEELTFPYSLDSYKSPTMSIQGLLRECLSIIRESKTVEDQHLDKSMTSLSHIVEEIRFRLKGNFIAKSISSLNLDNLISPRHEKERIDDVARRFEIAYAELNNQEYFHELVASIITVASDASKKEKMDFLAREYVSFLQWRGVSRDHIQKTLIDFFWEGNEISRVEQFKDFCKEVYPHNHTFKVIFGINKVIASMDERTLRRSSAYVINEDDMSEYEGFSEDFIDEVKRFKGKVGLTNLCMVLVTATDYNSAVVSAKSSLEAVYNFFRVFSHKDEMQISNVALVEQDCCEGDFKTIPSVSNTMHYIRDMRKGEAKSVMARYSEKISLDVGPDSNKFQNIVNIHGMSLSVSSYDIQLVNMWTCLETITPSENSGSKISNVVSKVVTVLLLGYFNRITTNLLFEILRWNRRSFSKIVKSMPDQGSDLDLKTKFITLLSSELNVESRAELFRTCGNFELLKNRISSVSKILSDKKAALEKISSHEKLVQWQIYRIYRSRNSIVHSGESPEYTRYLVENAHDFFDQALLFCLELSAWKPGFGTFLSCFDYAEAQYRAYLKSLKQDDHSKIVWQLPRYRDNSIVFGDE